MKNKILSRSYINIMDSFCSFKFIKKQIKYNLNKHKPIVWFIFTFIWVIFCKLTEVVARLIKDYG